MINCIVLGLFKAPEAHNMKALVHSHWWWEATGLATAALGQIDDFVPPPTNIHLH